MQLWNVFYFKTFYYLNYIILALTYKSQTDTNNIYIYNLTTNITFTHIHLLDITIYHLHYIAWCSVNPKYSRMVCSIIFAFVEVALPKILSFYMTLRYQTKIMADISVEIKMNVVILKVKMIPRKITRRLRISRNSVNHPKVFPTTRNP